MFTRPVAWGLIASALTLLLVPGAAHAYVGPGAGLTAIGTVLALVGAMALAAVGFVWYPIKRMLRRSPTDGSRIRTADEWGVEEPRDK